MCSGEYGIAHTQCAVLHEHGSDIAATLVERRLDDRASGVAFGVSLEFKHLSLEEHFLHQLLYAYTFLG